MGFRFHYFRSWKQVTKYCTIFENEIHHHEAGAHHTLADHHLKHHHEEDEDDEDMDGNNFISLLLGFFHPNGKQELAVPEKLKIDYNELVCVYSSINLPPLTPPPLAFKAFDNGVI